MINIEYIYNHRIWLYKWLPLQSTHLKTDLINIGHYKNLNTIGKQNYQEPGVEAELNFEFFESFHFIF